MIAPVWVVLFLIALRLVPGLLPAGTQRLFKGLTRAFVLLSIAALAMRPGAALAAPVLLPLIAIGGTLSLPLLLPWPFARRIWLPLGWVRPTYYAARYCNDAWGRDRTGGAAFAGAWALMQQAEPSSADLAWLRARIGEASALTPATLGAHGLLAAIRGDRAEARAFLEAVSLFDHRIAAPLLRERAIDWLVADAASEGRWAHVITLTSPPSAARRTTRERSLAEFFFEQGKIEVGLSPDAALPHDLSEESRLVRGIAQRILDAPDAPDDAQLEVLWQQIPLHRRPDRAILQLARRSRPAPAVCRDQTQPEDGDLLITALSRHVDLLQRPDPAQMAAAAEAWEIALDEIGPRLADRAIQLGALRGDPLATIRSGIEQILSEIADAGQIALQDLDRGGLQGSARDRLREELLSAIELAVDALQRRVDAKRWLPALEEAREWLLLARLYAEGVEAGGDEIRRLMFRSLYHPLSSLSVELHNHRGERWLSNAITRWLLREAHAAGDQRAVELQERNLNI